MSRFHSVTCLWQNGVKPAARIPAQPIYARRLESVSRNICIYLELQVCREEITIADGEEDYDNGLN